MTFREFMKENDYELQTTFWNDFTIADHFGLAGIQAVNVVANVHLTTVEQLIPLRLPVTSTTGGRDRIEA